LETETQPTEVAATPPAEEQAASLSLEERVAFLEAQNEGLKRVGALGLALTLLLGVLLVHQTYSNLGATSTRSITLLNDANELSAALTSDRQGRTQYLQARYGVLPNGTEDPPGDFEGVTFYDPAGKPRLMLGQTRETQETVFLVLDPTRGLAFNPFENAKPAPRPGGTPTPGAPVASPTPAPPAATPGSPSPTP
jgi:hypothetical protein